MSCWCKFLSGWDGLGKESDVSTDGNVVRDEDFDGFCHFGSAFDFHGVSFCIFEEVLSIFESDLGGVIGFEGHIDDDESV